MPFLKMLLNTEPARLTGWFQTLAIAAGAHFGMELPAPYLLFIVTVLLAATELIRSLVYAPATVKEIKREVRMNTIEAMEDETTVPVRRADPNLPPPRRGD